MLLMFKEMAERVGFEPTLEFPLNTLSKRAPSTTRPPLPGMVVFLNLAQRQAPLARTSRDGLLPALAILKSLTLPTSLIYSGALIVPLWSLSHIIPCGFHAIFLPSRSARPQFCLGHVF